MKERWEFVHKLRPITYYYTLFLLIMENLCVFFVLFLVVVAVGAVVAIVGVVAVYEVSHAHEKLVTSSTFSTSTHLHGTFLTKFIAFAGKAFVGSVILLAVETEWCTRNDFFDFMYTMISFMIINGYVMIFVLRHLVWIYILFNIVMKMTKSFLSCPLLW